MLGIQGLIRLSKLDLEIRLIEKEIETADDGSGLQSEIANLTQIVAQGEAIFKKNRSELEDNKLQLDKSILERKKIESSMFQPNTSVKRLEELQDHKKKIDKFIDELETKGIGLMDQSDKIGEKLAKAKKLLDNKKQLFEQKSTEFKKLKLKGEIKMADIKRDRDQLVPTISKDLTTIYDKLMNTKNGLAMVEVAGNQCNGCQQTIPSVIIQAVRDEPEELHYCNNCGRLIYIWRNE